VDGSELVFILMPIVIPLFLAIGIAAPYIADSRSNKRPSSEQPSVARSVPAGRDGLRCQRACACVFRPGRPPGSGPA